MNTQRHRNITWACALCFSLFSGPCAQAGGFARAGAQYVGYTASGFSNETGFSVAAGTTWGATQEHELSLEAMRADWSWRDTLGQTMVPGVTGRGHFTPLLLNYRHSFGTAASGFRFYAGASAGVAKTSGEVTVALSGSQYRGTPDETGLAWGATLGITGKLTGVLAYDLGYRYLQAEGFDTPSVLFMGVAGYTGGPGPAIRVPARSAHCLALSLRISF
jgi:opacity protein-like surface antigen